LSATAELLFIISVFTVHVQRHKTAEPILCNLIHRMLISGYCIPRGMKTPNSPFLKFLVDVDFL